MDIFVWYPDPSLQVWENTVAILFIYLNMNLKKNKHSVGHCENKVKKSYGKAIVFLKWTQF